MKAFAPCALVAMAGWGLISCASISVQEDAAHTVALKPEKIDVANFDVSRGEFNVDRTGAELADFQRHLQLMMSTGIKTDLTNRLIYTEPATKTTGTHPERAWLIRGEFIKVNQGSRLLRSTIGFGAGGTKLETAVSVYDLAGNPSVPFLQFKTTGGSGAEPGAAVALTTDPLQLAIGGVSGIAHGLSEDTARTAREITAELSDYMFRQGWIPESRHIEPKKLSGNSLP